MKTINGTHIIADIELFSEYCNLQCEYCFLGKSSNKYIPIDKQNIHMNNAINIIEKLKLIKMPIVKLSGGEIFLLNSIVDLCSTYRNDFEKIQLLTNGTLLSKENIDKIQNIKNIGIQLSLDGHTYEMNIHRYKSTLIFQHVIKNLNYLLKKQIPLEINMVLTKDNIHLAEEFIKVLTEKSGNVIVYFMPVREETDKLSVKENQIHYLKSILENYKQYTCLPPKAYLEHLIYYLINKRKYNDWKCWISQTVLSVNGNGDLSICTDISKKNSFWGNIFNNKDKCFQDLRICNILTNRSNILPHCTGCYAHYEIINLLLNGYIEFEELNNIWFYDGAQSRSTLSKMKDRSKNILEC